MAIDGATRGFARKSIKPDGATRYAAHRDETPSDFPNYPETIPVNGEFSKALFKPECPLCGNGAKTPHESIFEQINPEAEMTVHLTSMQTAFLSTASEALARLTGNDAFRKSQGATIAEICRIFLLTDPVISTRLFDWHGSSVAKGSWRAREKGFVDVVPADPAESEGVEFVEPAESAATVEPHPDEPQPANNEVPKEVVEEGERIVMDDDSESGLYPQPSKAARQPYSDVPGEEAKDEAYLQRGINEP